jgi:hypothetical protein
MNVGRVPFASLWRVLAAVMLVAAVATWWGSTRALGAPGNNGTVKIHDSETHEEDRRNEPHVCEFYLAGFNFDHGQTGTWEIKGHPPTAGAGSRSRSWGPADSEGRWRSADMSLADGHYKLEWETGQGDGKHKVFWVDCPDTTPTPAPTNTPVRPTATPMPPTATPGGPTPTPAPPTVTPVPGTATPVPTGTPDGDATISGAPPTGGAAPVGPGTPLAAAFAAVAVIVLASGAWAHNRWKNAQR